MKAARWLLLILIVSWGVGPIAGPASGADLYHGRVVDEETGQPLSGAVLTVVWFRSPIVALGGGRDFHSAQETVTDSDGKFSLVVSPGIDWNPFTYIRKEPEIVIYQPGYEPTWAGWRVRNKLQDDKFAEALKKGVTIKLPKLKTKEQVDRIVNLGLVVHVLVPRSSIPNLARAVDRQRKLVGLRPLFPEPADGGKKP